MSVRAQIRLREAISRALEDYSNAIDVEGLMLKKLPWYLPAPMGV